MSKVTRIAYSKNLNQSKYDHLLELAGRLGKLRAEVWQRFGSMGGVGIDHRQIRDQWLAAGREFSVPARLWKETLRDTLADIGAYREAAKVKVRQAIWKRRQDEAERKRLYRLLKYDRWVQESYLRRMMRKYYQHGQTQVDNQIVLDTGCYTAFERNGQGWLKVMSLEPGKRICIPLNTSHLPTGTLRLILRDERVEVHYSVNAEEACSTKPCGQATIGIDKGYTEVFTDSDGEVHGEQLGELLSRESDSLKVKYQRRNKLKAIAEAKPHKRDNIYRNNLGRKKLNERKRKHTAQVRDKIFKATHTVVDKARMVVCEDLTGSIKSRAYSKDQNRRLAGWVKGIMAEAIDAVSQRRGSTLEIVNAAYTSQTDSRYGVLLGQRRGDTFYCFDGEVLNADTNAAQNILSRRYDSEIHLYTPYRDVKNILLERTEQFEKRLGLLNQDTSCTRNVSDINGERNAFFLMSRFE
jgi:IS605 OrfB family transposase